jgi:selenocysteine-specific elongation factor
VQTLESGQTGWGQLVLDRPAIVAKHDRFILRQPSPSLTIGGGTIVDPHPARRHRRFRPETVQRLETLAHGTPEEIMLAAVQRAEPVEARQVIRNSGLGEGAASALAALLQDGSVLALGVSSLDPVIANLHSSNQLVMSQAGWMGLFDRLLEAARDYHRAYPLRAMMPREEARSRIGPGGKPLTPRVFNLLVDDAVVQGRMVAAEAGVRLADHAVRYTPQQQTLVDRLMAQFTAQPYTPPSIAEATAQVGADLFGSLVEQGRLTRVSDDVVFTSEVYQTMVQRIVAHLTHQGKITVAEVRDLFGASRKYALALMEHLDQKGVTRRQGDERVLR